MSLLTAWIVKNNNFAAICFIFLKNVLHYYTGKAFNTKFRPQWKDRESSYQVRLILAPFCKLVSLILSYNCFKGLRVTKIVKQIRFEGFMGNLETRNCFQRHSFTKFLKQFSCKIVHYEKNSISLFQEILITTDEIFILGGKLRTY